MSAQSDFYLEHAERLIGKDKADELKRLLKLQHTSAFFTRKDAARLQELLLELMTC